MTSAWGLAVLCAALLPAWPVLCEPFRPQAPTDPNRDMVQPQGFPAIGKWMLTAQGVPSDWLGEIDQGRVLREPINVVIIDESAASPEAAVARLIAGTERAGYPVRLGHSTGYQALIGGQFYAQLPKGWDDAFSNGVFELSNNHGRIFGPYRMERFYLFTGAFSRERVDPFRWPGHRYESFNRARDDFAAKLDRNTAYRASGFIALGNETTDDPVITTGDHDGRAVVLRAGQ